jgi:hypothetical protein
MAIHRATGDPVYLEAAKRIIAVPLKEQKLDQGGWPHVLPRDHAGSRPGAVGNNLFLIGVLLAGMKDYHELTKDPAVEKSLVAGVRWVAKSWDENAEGWPYSATADGEALYTPNTGLNTLIAEPIAYVGQLTGDEQLVHIAETAMAAAARGGPDAFGKSLAQKLHFTAGALALLQQWFDTHRADKGATAMDGGTGDLLRYIAKTPDARALKVRAPDEKVFWVKLTNADATLVATRTPHGAKPKAWPTGTIRVLDATGAEVKSAEYSTDDTHEFRLPIRAAAGAVYKVVVKDDQRAVWNVSGENVAVVAQTAEGFSLGGIGRGRFWFFVPQGTNEFRVKLLGVHPGVYGVAAIAPGGKLVAYHQGVNPGGTQLPWAADKAQTADAHPERGELVVKPSPDDTGKVWSLVLWAATDLACELKGVPPYLAARAEDWFQPQ